MKRFEREISRRKRQTNLRKHQGIRQLSKAAIKAAEAQAWPSGIPKLSDVHEEINKKKVLR